MFEGKLLAIYTAPKTGADMLPSDAAEILAGRGLVGDRYDQSAPSRKPDEIRQVTLIEKEAFEGLQREYSLEVDPKLARRNLLTEGVPLNHLIGRQFRVGDAILEGTEMCEPCAYVSKLTGIDLLGTLKHRGGIRARVLQSGSLHVGDPIRSIE